MNEPPLRQPRAGSAFGLRLLLATLAAILLGAPACDGGGAGAADAGSLPLDDGCGATASLDWIAALRARAAAGPGVSVLVAPGEALADLRAPLAADATASALVDRARAQLAAPDPDLAVGDSETYQVVASRALAAALVAWVDGDAAAAARARGLVAQAAIDEAWLDTATEIPIRVGGALVALAGAVDLLGAGRGLAADEAAAARRDLGQAARAVDAWARLTGAAFLLAADNNHNVRLGAGLLAAGLVAGPDDLDDEAVAYALAEITSVVHDSQSGPGVGWAEGPTYFAYGFEVAAPALAALGPAWPLPGPGCLTCPDHLAAPCAGAPVLALLPDADEVLRGAVLWLASLETGAGWFAPVDDSRLGGAPAPLLERLVGARLFRAWRPDGPGGSLGGSVDVGPFVAVALVAPPGLAALPALTPAPLWPQAGSARVDLTAGDGAAVEAFLFAEGEKAQRGRGHERPDPLSLVVAVDGALLLGPSGYGRYEERGPLSRADASTLITIDGRLPDDEGVTTPGPPADLTAVDGGAHGQLTLADADVGRTLRGEGAQLVIEDRVRLRASHEVAWHWHLRGTVTAVPDGERWAWERDGRRCVARQSGLPAGLETVVETAPDVDSYGVEADHPVVRQRATLPAGDYAVVTLIVCSGS